MAGRFEILKDSNGSYWFRLTAADGTVVAESPTFKHLKGAVDGINAVRENAATGLIIDRSSPVRSNPARSDTVRSGAVRSAQDGRAAAQSPACKAA